MVKIYNMIKALCLCPGVSGSESHVCKVVENMLKDYCDDVHIDDFNNVIGIKRSRYAGAKTLVLDAHIDQIGLIITDASDDGFLKFRPVGGVDQRMLLGAEVDIITDVQTYFGVISCIPPHLITDADKKVSTPVSEMIIDTGLSHAKKKIPVGSVCVFHQDAVLLKNDRICSKALDDRAGVAIILYALSVVMKHELKVNLLISASCQEETGALGAKMISEKYLPDLGIAIDVSHGRTPDAPPYRTYEFSGGVMIGKGPNLHPIITDKLISFSGANNIPYQIEVMEGNTGTNAWVIQTVNRGIPVGLLSIPLRYMHTPIECITLKDFESAYRLLAEFILNFDPEVML